ncbi:hypothetical protein D3C71_1895480 [compost metagenome]
MMAPNPPVARPKVAGKENIPAPIMDPTTRAVRDHRDNLFVDELVMVFFTDTYFY